MTNDGGWGHATLLAILLQRSRLLHTP